MAHAFDNRNIVPNKQQIFYSVDSSSLSERGIKSDLWERSSSPQLSSRSNHSPLSYEETVFNKTLANHQNSKSSTSNDSSYRQRQQQQQPVTGINHINRGMTNTYIKYFFLVTNLDDYLTFTSENHNSETKPPPLTARIPRMTSTTNNNYIRRPNILSQYPPNGIKKNKTYLNTTQLYITQPSSQDSPPPPPPPRHPLYPPAIPPRNPLNSYQKNSVTIPDFNSSVTAKAIYRSPVVLSSSSSEKNDIHEHRSNSFSIDDNNNHHHQNQDTTNESTVGEYFGIIFH